MESSLTDGFGIDIAGVQTVRGAAGAHEWTSRKWRRGTVSILMEAEVVIARGKALCSRGYDEWNSVDGLGQDGYYGISMSIIYTIICIIVVTRSTP